MVVVVGGGKMVVVVVVVVGTVVVPTCPSAVGSRRIGVVRCGRKVGEEVGVGMT